MLMRTTVVLALPLLALAACTDRYQTSAAPDPNGVSRETQIEACANHLAQQSARPRADIQAFYDRDGYNGNALVNVSGPTGTLQCEVDKSLNVTRLTKTGSESPKA